MNSDKIFSRSPDDRGEARRGRFNGMTQENEFPLHQFRRTRKAGKITGATERARERQRRRLIIRLRESREEGERFNVPILASERWSADYRTEHSSAPFSEVFHVGIRFTATADFRGRLSSLAGIKLGRSSVQRLHTYVTFWSSKKSEFRFHWLQLKATSPFCNDWRHQIFRE